jgi:hypothetical protein
MKNNTTTKNLKTNKIMTLTEENFDYQPDEKIVLHSQKYVDDFAIGFAEWYEFMLRQTDNLTERFTKNEILEIYKKEKGL